jgi:glycogen operon protein
MLSCLMLGQGVPLLLAGDEVGNSQRGNNNAYCQDNEIGWVDWSGLGREGDDMCSLIADLVDLRRRFPQLRPKHWIDGRRPDDSFGVLWLTPQANEMAEKDWNFPQGRFLAYALGALAPDEPVLYVVLNASPQTIAFKLPNFQGYRRWVALLNTAERLESLKFLPGAHLHSPGNSVLAFAGFP